ncbi:MAG: glycosyltransferase [Chloroflexota bacterium]|nr:glycosyltransferase [Chloroflexota bacterium]
MRIDVVIPSAGRIDALYACLASLYDMRRPPDAVSVVLQGSPAPEVTERITATLPNVQVMVIPTIGASAARNAGAAASGAEVVAFLDDDCTVAPDWLDAIASAFEDPEIDLVSGRVRPDGSGTLVLAGQTHAEPRTFRGRRNPVGTVDRSGNMAIRVDAMTAVGGFDESLGPGTLYRAAEDTDLVYRLMKAGAQLRYAPAMCVVHRHWRDRSDSRATERGYAFGLGAMIAKHAQGGDLYALTLLPRLIWHMGLRPVIGGMLNRDPEHVRSGFRYLAGLPLGFISRLARR